VSVKSRRTIWLAIGLLVVCGWCNLLSGLGGWLMGYDLGWREGRVEQQATMQTAPISTGVLVIRVQRGSPADAAGITRNDLITAVNGILVEDVPALRSEILRYRPGDNIEITFLHERGEVTTEVQLDRFPDREEPYLGIYYTARAEDPADL
jgi:membrane-associated protease RseP (regulator of RpoE activity)